MALPDILAAIAGEADQEAASVRARAEQDALELIARADAEVAALDAQCAVRRQRFVDAAVARIVHAAGLDAVRRVQDAREQVVNQVLGRVRASLARLRERPDHEAILARWLSEVRSALPDGAVLRVAEDDVALAGRLGPDLQVVADATMTGGLVLEAPDGRSAVNTPAVRAARAEPSIRSAIARTLVG